MLTVANVSWLRLPGGPGAFMAGGWRDSAGRTIIALVSGRRGEWSYQIQRRAGREVEMIATGTSPAKLGAMRAATEIVREYF